MFDKRKLSLSLEARRDLRESYDYYEQTLAGLGKRFVGEFADVIDAIAKRPGSFPTVHRSARRAMLRRFPNGVFFRDLGTHLEIFAVVDLRRHPREWRRRA